MGAPESTCSGGFTRLRLLLIALGGVLLSCASASGAQGAVCRSRSDCGAGLHCMEEAASEGVQPPSRCQRPCTPGTQGDEGCPEGFICRGPIPHGPTGYHCGRVVDSEAVHSLGREDGGA